MSKKPELEPKSIVVAILVGTKMMAARVKKRGDLCKEEKGSYIACGAGNQ